MAGSLDPRGYDTAELRELARLRGDRYAAYGFLWKTPPDPLPPGEGDAEFDRPVTWAGSLDERQKPYLRRLPEDERGRQVAREWVAELVERAGTHGAAEALSYYESIGWLTGPVREGLADYLLAVDYREGGSLEELTRGDHVESLGRTARLAGLVDPAGDRPGEREDTAPGEAGRPYEERDVDADGSGGGGRSTGAAGSGPGVEREEGEEEEGVGAGTGTEAETGTESGTETEADGGGVPGSGFEFGGTTK